ncbi:MAG TPA: PspC domain-containing protein [Allosphingosinicella sp.]|nr:PspC domain-containing protein [Allosphingosinicella sp.]
MKKAFRLDKGNAMLLGVCGGIADLTGFNVTLVRIAAVFVTLLGAFPWTLLAYGVVAWIAAPKQSSPDQRFEGSVPATGRGAGLRAEADAYVDNANHGLARQIDALR